MKTKFLLSCLFLLPAFTVITSEEQLCRTEAECEDDNNPCLCWCAFEPGPRKKKIDKDNPHFPKIPGLKNVCYCADRDVEKDLQKRTLNLS